MGMNFRYIGDTLPFHFYEIPQVRALPAHGPRPEARGLRCRGPFKRQTVNVSVGM